MRSHLRLFQVGLSIVLLGVLIWQVDVSVLLDRGLDFGIDWLWLVLLLVLSLLLRAWRWMVLMNAVEHRAVDLVLSIRLLLVGAAINLVVPAGLGDVAKGYFGYKWTGIKESMASVSVFDKVLAIAGVGALGLVMAIRMQWPVIVLPSVLALGPAIGCIIAAHRPAGGRLDRWVGRLDARIRRLDVRRLLDGFAVRPGVLVHALVVSVVAWVLTYAMMHLCFRIAGEPIVLPTVLAQSPTLTLARLFPFTFNGIGSDEYVILALFRTSRTTDEGILLGALVYRLVLMVLPALLGILVMLTAKKRHDAPLQDLEDDQVHPG